MESATIDDHPRGDQAAPSVACTDCGQLEHPEFTCAQALELIRAAALRKLLAAHGPILLAALVDAADDRVERADSYCIDCVHAGEQRCETHRDDVERAAEYRRTYDELWAALDR